MVFYLFQVLIELTKKRERDLSRKTIFEIGIEEEDVINDTEIPKNELNLAGEDLL